MIKLVWVFLFLPLLVFGQSRGGFSDLRFSQDGTNAALSFKWAFKGLVKIPEPSFRLLVLVQEGDEDPSVVEGGAENPELASSAKGRKTVLNRGEQTVRVILPVDASLHDYRIEMWANGHLVGFKHSPKFTAAYIDGKGLDRTWWIPKAKAQGDDFGANVNSAIEDARTYIAGRQLDNGSWVNAERPDYHPEGYTAFAAYALVKSGTKTDDPAITKAIAYLKENPADDTYAVACKLMLLSEFGRTHSARIADLVKLLERRQADGTWSYETGNGDLSNTQFAALGLWAAHRAAMQTSSKESPMDSKVFRNLAKVLSKYYNADYSFSYQKGMRRSNERTGTDAMTAAGAGLAMICRTMIPEDPRTQKLRTELAAMGKQGSVWLGRAFHEETTPYTLYAIERLAALTKAKTIGRHDWYVEGAEHLMDAQAGDGAVVSEEGIGGDLANTAFALLFWKRATAAAIDPDYDPDAYLKKEEEKEEDDVVDVEEEPAVSDPFDAKYPMFEVGEKVTVLTTEGQRVSGTVVDLGADLMVLERDGRKGRVPYQRLDGRSRVRCDEAYRARMKAKFQGK